MDFVNKLAGGNSNSQSANEQVSNNQQSQQSSGSGGFLGGLGDKLNSAAGGGRESEKNEDYLDKGKSNHSTSSYGLELTCSHYRCRLCPREVHGCRPSGQRVCA